LFEDGSQILEVAIFNHLDIKVLVHQSYLTEAGLASSQETVKFNNYGYEFEVPVPVAKYKIVGFEVTPRSVPISDTYDPTAPRSGMHVPIPGEPFKFSYSTKVVLSDLQWPHRFDHYFGL
jgi:hypothetical protein